MPDFLQKPGLVRDEYTAAQDEHEMNIIDNVAKRLGVTVRFVDSVLGGKANAQHENGVIEIEKYNRNPVLFLFGHELTHYLQEVSPDSYQAFCDAAMMGTPNANAIVRGKIRLYEKNGVKLERKDAIDELAADYAGQMMDNLNVLERFIERHGENRTLLQHLADAFRSLIDRVGGRYRVNAKNAVTLLEKALDDGARAVDKTERQKAKENAATKGDGAQYAIMETRDGKKYVRADRQVIFGNDPEKWVEQLEDYINGKIRRGQDVVLIGADGDELRLTATSAGKLSDNHTGDGRTMSAEAYERKANAASHIDELAQVSFRGKKDVNDYDSRHGDMASGGWNYRTAYFEDFDGKYYAVTISAAKNNSGTMIYNIGVMKEEAHPKIIGSRASDGDGLRGFASSGNRVHNSGEIVKSRQSIKESDTNAPQAGSDENAEKALAAGVELDAGSESAAPASYSLKTWLDSDYVTDSAEAAKAIAAQLGVSVGTARRYIRSINGIAKMIADDRERLDYEASPDRSSFVSNSEYGGSIDFSTICAKRRLLTGTLEAIQRELPNTALTAEEVLSVRKMMAEMGYVVSCGLCYVEGSRAKMGEYTKEFLDEYAKTNPAYLPNMAEMNTATGQEQIRLEHPEVYDAYVKFMNKLAQRKPKMYQLATEYKGEVLSKFGNKRSAATVAAKNRNGGLRLQSFSDFEIIHLLDCMQVITDMSRVGLAGQAYTKVPDFARALGKTGLKINLSLIAKGVDSNGNIVLDEVEGMARADAEQLRNKYSSNVGTILVTFTDEQLMAAMKEPFIDFIIPFHRSQWGKAQYTMLGLPAEAKDYTPWQNESYIEPVYNESGNAQRPSNYMPNEYWDFSRSGKENAETYLKMCAENNRVPKFSNLLVKNADGSYSLQPDGSTDGYWKLLIDFKMYTNGGKGAPQRPVKPRFDMREARRMLNEYEGGHESFPVAQDIVDEFVAQYKQTHPGKQYSLKEDSDGRAVAVVENDILSNIDTSTWDNTKKAQAKAAAKAALIALKGGVQVNGIGYKINRTSRREFTRSKDTERLYRRNPDAFADKMRAANVADDVITATTDWARDGRLKHPRTDNFVDFAHGSVLIQAGNNQYNAETVVGITKNGEYVFYDVVDMTPTSFKIKEESPTTAAGKNAASDIQGDSSEDKVTQAGADVKKQHSMKNDDMHERLRQHLADVQREQNESAWDRLGAKITVEIKAAVQENWVVVRQFHSRQ